MQNLPRTWFVFCSSESALAIASYLTSITFLTDLVCAKRDWEGEHWYPFCHGREPWEWAWGDGQRGEAFRLGRATSLYQNLLLTLCVKWRVRPQSHWPTSQPEKSATGHFPKCPVFSLRDAAFFVGAQSPFRGRKFSTWESL